MKYITAAATAILIFALVIGAVDTDKVKKTAEKTAKIAMEKLKI